jgi:rhodanese-related sulfurtransferase/predicted small lipoprotein YifL
MNKFVWMVVIVTGMALAGCGGTTTEAEAPPAAAAEENHGTVEVVEAVEMDPAAVQARIDAGEPLFLLDVRNPDELVEHGQIKGAVNIPIDQLEARLAEVPKDVPIVTYCMRGGRASRAAETLREAGYEKPIEFGGITAWKEAGLEVVQPDSE